MKKIHLILTICSAAMIAFLSVTYLMTQRASSPAKKSPEYAQINKNGSLSDEKTSDDSLSKPAKKVAATPPACGQFTEQLARQVIGINAAADMTKSVINSETLDIKVGTCVYTAHQKSIRVVSHIAKTDLGRSMNAVAFGSNRPSGTQIVQGYGQAAFWDSNASTLFVLKNNNQYDISISSDLQSTEPAAAIIIPKL